MSYTSYLEPFTFLEACQEKAFPLLKNRVCNQVQQLHPNASRLEALCRVIRNIPDSQGTILLGKFCYRASLAYVDFLTLPQSAVDSCNQTNRGGFDVRSMSKSSSVVCAYEIWQESSSVDPSVVATCSENDKENFIRAVCMDSAILKKLSESSDNDWLPGHCAYYSINGFRSILHDCNYLTWSSPDTSTVAYCWLYDEVKFSSYLCMNSDVLQELRQDPDNQWLEPSCSPSDASSLPIAAMCDYTQWDLTVIEISQVSFCANNDGGQFAATICGNQVILDQLLANPSISWVVEFCVNISTNVLSTAFPSSMCVYSTWQQSLQGNFSSGSSSAIAADPSAVRACSTLDQSGFVNSVCNNPNLLQVLAWDPRNSWLKNFCFNFVFILEETCNYSTWLSLAPNSSLVTYCWMFDEAGFSDYLCMNAHLQEQLWVNSEKQLLEPNCSIANGMEGADSLPISSLCNYSRWDPATTDFSKVGFCAQYDDTNFQNNMCNNPLNLKLLLTNTYNSWLSQYCVNFSLVINSLSNTKEQCSYSELAAWSADSILAPSIDPASIMGCGRSDKENFTNSVCSNASVLLGLTRDRRNEWLLDFCSKYSSPDLLTVLATKVCLYSKWTVEHPSLLLVSFCWMHDKVNFVNVVCINQQLTNQMSMDPKNLWIQPNCSFLSPHDEARSLPTPQKSCAYHLWNPASVDYSTVSFCAQFDRANFTRMVCANLTTVNMLANNTSNSWVYDYCLKSSGNLPNSYLAELCNYGDWSTKASSSSSTVSVAPTLLLVCRENDKWDFGDSVCNDARLLQALTKDLRNDWLLDFCTNISHPDILNLFIVWRSCIYSTWTLNSIDTFLVSYCWMFDELNFLKYLCNNSQILKQIKENPDNFWLEPDCKSIVVPVDKNVLESRKNQCTYKTWNPSTVDYSLVRFCADNDGKNFTNAICTNVTAVRQLKENPNNTWIPERCVASITIVFNRFSTQQHCTYQAWRLQAVNSSLLELCWVYDQSNFTQWVCNNTPLVERLVQETINAWLKPACHYKNSSFPNRIQDAVLSLCQYGEWPAPVLVDVSIVTLCSTYDQLNFVANVCGNELNLLDEYGGSSISAFCINNTSPGDPFGFVPSEMCLYDTWMEDITDPTILALCWDYDQANFVDHICQNKDLLSYLISQPDNLWIMPLCANANKSVSPGDPGPPFCLLEKVKTQFNWSCSVDLHSACQGGGLSVGSLLPIMQCGLENAGLSLQGSSLADLSQAYDGALDALVLLLLVLEDSQIISLTSSGAVQTVMLQSVLSYLQEAGDSDSQRELLQCFGGTLLKLALAEPSVPTKNQALIKMHQIFALKRSNPPSSATERHDVSALGL
ncbi:hypothetical protein NDU88_004413 [Pleurodeles waltl]|uniref:Uncharacterized protein n=1 Tax=Pleurodeles waltl TaxID=8319 RepID=A0AAV7TU61_PLEWA|nr:hypothetical protein NDU88_004413 [Pleurodeles waltl]